MTGKGGCPASGGNRPMPLKNTARTKATPILPALIREVRYGRDQTETGIKM